MSQNKMARAHTQLVQAFKLRRLSAQILREAEALEAAAEPVIAAWDDPAITRYDMGDSDKPYETADTAINPKEADELLNLIEGDKSAISDEEGIPKAKQNKGNHSLPKSKDKWSSKDQTLRQKVAPAR